MMKLILYIGVFLSGPVLSAQIPNKSQRSMIDSLSLAMANEVAEEVLGSEKDNMTYTVFSIGEHVLFVHKTCCEYKLYTFERKFDYEKQRNVFRPRKETELKEDDVLNKVFASGVCSDHWTKAEMDSINQRHANWDSKYIYFLVSEKGTKGCEFTAPITYKTDVKHKMPMPLSNEVFDYLALALLIRNK